MIKSYKVSIIKLSLPVTFDIIILYILLFIPILSWIALSFIIETL